MQETFYATARDRLARFTETDIERYIMFWGGYNISHESWENETERDSILNRYLAMAEDAAHHGISSIHWSKLAGSGSNTLAEHAEWNAKYADGIATLQAQYPAVRIIWYDHRHPPHGIRRRGEERGFFRGRPPPLQLGQATLVADFLSRFPAPPAASPESP